jgi:transcriptional regulator with GAF, ATPase, and Fis domain
MTENQTYRSNDLRSEQRFPGFASRTVAETGVLSMLSFRLFTDEETFGALNLYATRSDAFDEWSLTLGAIFATHAALAFDRVHEHEENENLERALATNREIAMAMGIVMADRGCTEEQAFAHLREISQRLNRKLRDIAADVVRTGEIPTASGGMTATNP